MQTEIGSNRIRLINILMLLSFTRLSNADITPESIITEVLVNHSTIFNCSTSENDVTWYRYEMITEYRRYVYDEGKIRTTYEDRFRIEKNLTTGAFNLVLLVAKMEDAGKYECATKTGTTLASAELIVLYSDPECSSNLKPDGFLAQNICNMEPDKLQLSCSVRYRGKVPPSMEWKNVRRNSSKTNTDDAVTLNVTLEANDISNGSSFVCRTKRSTTQEYSCSVNVTKIIYFVPNDTAIEKTIEDEFSCSVKSSQQCTYAWYDDERFSVISKQTFRPKERGNYTCEAQCKVRGRICTFTAQRIYVVPVPPNDNNNQLLWWLILLPILAGIAAIIIYVLYKRHQQRDRPRRSSNTENLESSKNPENVVLLKAVPGSNNRTEESSIQMKPVIPCLKETPSEETDLEPFVKMEYFLHKGALGELYGPFDWNCNNSDKQFICRRIPFAREKYADLKDIFRETAEKWMNLDHQHVQRIYYAGVREKTNSVFLYMMIEHVEGSDLKAALKLCKSKLPLNIVKDWAKQIAEGMKYLHEREIIHKSLKSQHVILEKKFDPSNATPNTLKIAGYTLSVERDHSASTSFQEMFSAMAPESLKDSVFTKHSDVYSYAMLILEIINKKSPSEGLKPQERFARIGSPQLEEIIPHHYPPGLHELVRKCLEHNPESRPTFADIVTRLHEVPVKMPIFEGTPSAETDLEPFFKTESFFKRGLMGDLHGPFEWVNDKTIEPFICRRSSFVQEKYKDEAKILFREKTEKWMTLRHRNVLSIYYAGTRERTNAVFLYMMIEYGAGGDLKTVLKPCQSTLPQSAIPLPTIKDWAKQVAEGMKYLHENGIVHKFLKSELVILERPFDPSNPTPNTLKIAGFTLSVEKDHSASTSFGDVFTAMAPECLSKSEFTERSDVYSYAVIVWEIVNRKNLSDGLKAKDRLNLIGKIDLTAEISDSYPVELRNLVRECSGVDPMSRPTFAEIIPRLDQIPGQS